jgi:hypothetical protein
VQKDVESLKKGWRDTKSSYGKQSVLGSPVYWNLSHRP